MSKIPEDYPTVTPYLIIKNAAAFIQFTQDVFGAALINKYMRDENIIMHGEIKIGNSIIMFAESTAEYTPMNAGLFIYVEDADVTYKKALDKGATAVTRIRQSILWQKRRYKRCFWKYMVDNICDLVSLPQ